MLSSDLTHPSTIAVLLLEVALFGLALAAASGRFIRPIRSLARGLAVVTLVVGSMFAAGMIMEVWTSRLAFARPEAPLGTYADMTQLGLLVGALHLALVAAGSAVAFGRPKLGALLLVVAGLYGVIDSLRTLVQDPSLPLGSFIVGLLLMLFILAVGALLLGTWLGEQGRAGTSGQVSGSTARAFPAAP